MRLWTTPPTRQLMTQSFRWKSIQLPCISWICLRTAPHWVSMIMWWPTFMTASFSLPPPQSITLQKVTIWRFGKMLQLFILCPAIVCVAMKVFQLMKLPHTWVCIGTTSLCSLVMHMLNALRNSGAIFKSFPGFRPFRAIKQFCIKSWSFVCSRNFGAMDQEDAETLAIWRIAEGLQMAPLSRRQVQEQIQQSEASRDQEWRERSRSRRSRIAAAHSLRHEDTLAVLLHNTNSSCLLPLMMAKS